MSDLVKMTKLTKLTDEQIARFPEFVDRWTKIGLCTDPANRTDAERAIAMMYRAANLEPPNRIVWCGSPLSQGLARAIVLDKKFLASVSDSIRDSVWARVRDSVGDSVWASIRDSVADSVGASVADSVEDSVGARVRDSVWASVADSIRDSIWARVRDSVSDSVWASVADSIRDSVWARVRDSVADSIRDSVWARVRDIVSDSVSDSVGARVRDSVGARVADSVWDSVEDSVGASIRDSVWASVSDSVRDSVYGSHDAGWLSLYRYFYDACALVEQTKKLEGLWLLAQSAGWALPHKNICWVSERHCVLERDERGRLHSLTGPAVAYPDGWAIYAFHGVRVPSHWIERADTLTAADVFKEQNAEVRRAGCEIIGWDRVLAGIDAKLVDADGDEFIGTLYRGTIPGAKECGFLKVRCGTGRIFVIPVAASCKSAIEAQAWIQNTNQTSWEKPEVRG